MFALMVLPRQQQCKLWMVYLQLKICTHPLTHQPLRLPGKKKKKKKSLLAMPGFSQRSDFKTDLCRVVPRRLLWGGALNKVLFLQQSIFTLFGLNYVMLLGEDFYCYNKVWKITHCTTAWKGTQDCESNFVLILQTCGCHFFLFFFFPLAFISLFL